MDDKRILPTVVLAPWILKNGSGQAPLPEKKVRSTQWKSERDVSIATTRHTKPTNAQRFDERWQIIKEKRLCFNCVAHLHRASDCHSTLVCRRCGTKHHTSLCKEKSKESESSDMAMLLKPNSDVIYPGAVVRVNGIKCRALIDTGARSEKRKQ